MSTERIESLRQALESAPDNHPLRLMLAEELSKAGQPLEAVEAVAELLEAAALPRDRLVWAAELALENDQLGTVDECLRRARDEGVVEGVAELQERFDAKRTKAGVLRLVRRTHTGDDSSSEPGGLLDREKPVRFDDIGGLDAVKKIIHRMIILPFRRPELYEKYGRRAGGGVMLFGPPGCGKTMLARGTAGECELPFYNVRIEEILGPYIGQSEANLHGAFEQARASAPCVLFVDELDALAYARRKQTGASSRSLVDQFLQELDAIGANNSNVLVLAATNAPWDVDDALKRPGRFDRVVFVPPPDEKARREILSRLLEGRPQRNLRIKELASQTGLFSGADLGALVERGIDVVIDEALDGGGEPPLEQFHFAEALQEMSASTLEWLSRARNYVEFANRTERYRDVEKYLRSGEVKKSGI